MKNFDDILKNSKENSGEKKYNNTLEIIPEQEFYKDEKNKSKSKKKHKKRNNKFLCNSKEKKNTAKENII